MIKLEKILKKLNTPSKIQDYLENLPFNFEKRGETYRSPSRVVEHGEAHCFEGALFALACLHHHGIPAFLLDIKTRDLKNDADHVVTLFKQGGKWGAISKTNHSVLRFRDPIYLSVRELAVSYFHEYFLDDGVKTAFSYSKPMSVQSINRKFGKSWVFAEEDLDEIALALDKSKHYNFYEKESSQFIRKASKLEIRTLDLTDY